MISDDAWLFASGILTLVCFRFFWWIGIRWRGVLFVTGCIILGGAIWGFLFDWMLYETLGSYAGLVIFLASFTGASIGGSACLIGLLAFHILRRRRQSRRLRSWLLGVDDPAVESDPIRLPLFIVYTILVAGIWTIAFNQLWFDRVTEMLAGAISAGALFLICWLVFDIERQRRGSRFGGRRFKTWTAHLSLSAAMERVERREHVRYAPHSNSAADTDRVLYEDWSEAEADPEAAAEVYVLIPRRTRVRFSPGLAPKLSNSFDCVILQRSSADAFRLTPASRSPFCRRIMKIIRTAHREATDQ